MLGRKLTGFAKIPGNLIECELNDELGQKENVGKNAARQRMSPKIVCISV